jgi:putative addiction module killer protein
VERTLVIYETGDGLRPFSEWLTGLRDRKARARIRARLNRVQLGNFGDCKGVGDGVSELRVDHGPGYRGTLAREAMCSWFCCAAETSAARTGT